MISQVAQRYADSLFDLATRLGVLDEVQRDVERIATAMADEQVARILLNPRLAAKARLERFSSLLSTCHRHTRNFVSLCFDKNREAVLLELGAAFKQRLLEAAGAVEGVVESARPLESGDVDRIARHLGTRLGKDVRLTNRVMPDLVGGVRVFVGSRMLDASVSGRLEDLRQKLSDVPLTSSH